MHNKLNKYFRYNILKHKNELFNYKLFVQKLETLRTIFQNISIHKNTKLMLISSDKRYSGKLDLDARIIYVDSKINKNILSSLIDCSNSYRNLSISFKKSNNLIVFIRDKYSLDFYVNEFENTEAFCIYCSPIPINRVSFWIPVTDFDDFLSDFSFFYVRELFVKNSR